MQLFKKKRPNSFLEGLKMAENASKGALQEVAFDYWDQIDLKEFQDGLEAFFKQSEHVKWWIAANFTYTIIRSEAFQ